MAEDKKYFIYKYEWDDGSVYIGQSHIGAYRYGKVSAYKDSPKVYNKMKKYPNFSKEIVRDKLTESEVDDFEKYYIEYYNSYAGNNREFGLNLSLGGYGRKGIPEEVRDKYSEIHKKAMTAEVREKISKTKKEYFANLTEEEKYNLYEHLRGKKMSENTRKAIFSAKNPQHPKYICLETNEIGTAGYFQDKYNIKPASISRAVKNYKGQKTANGYHFKLYEEEE